MKTLLLSRRLVALVDDDVFVWASLHRWHASGKRGKFYAARRLLSGQRIYLHRLLLSAPAGYVVDHINGNSLDNQRSNLRLATRQQNAQNRRAIKGKPHKGVRFSRGRYQAVLRVNGRKYVRGGFSSVAAAAEAYNELAREHYGEFACLNLARTPEPATSRRVRAAVKQKKGDVRLFKRDARGKELGGADPLYAANPFYFRFTYRGRSFATCLATSDPVLAVQRAKQFRAAKIQAHYDQLASANSDADLDATCNFR